jgi:predicted nuclease of predicted toxin-antitoxin system
MKILLDMNLPLSLANVLIEKGAILSIDTKQARVRLLPL